MIEFPPLITNLRNIARQAPTLREFVENYFHSHSTWPPNFPSNLPPCSFLPLKNNHLRDNRQWLRPCFSFLCKAEKESPFHGSCNCSAISSDCASRSRASRRGPRIDDSCSQYRVRRLETGSSKTVRGIVRIRGKRSGCDRACQANRGVP